MHCRYTHFTSWTALGPICLVLLEHVEVSVITKNIKFTDRKFNIFHTSVPGNDNKFTMHTNSFKLQVSIFCEIE